MQRASILQTPHDLQTDKRRRISKEKGKEVFGLLNSPTCSIGPFYSLNPSFNTFYIAMIYDSLLFVYDSNVKYQQIDFKYLNDMHCKNVAIYAC